MWHSKNPAPLFLFIIALTLIDGALSVSLTKSHIPGGARILGGFSSIDVEDAQVKEMADFATTAISESSNSRPLSLIKIVKAESQVVAGRNYKLVLELSSDVYVGGVSETEETLCEVIVFHQPWTQTRKLSKSNCLPIQIINSWATTRELVSSSANPQTAKIELVPDTPSVPIAGGFSLIDINDDSVKEMANFATKKISESSNSGPLALIKIVKAEYQAVAGTNYKLTLELGNTSNGAVGSNLICNVLVFHQSWTQTLKLEQSNCLAATIDENDIVTEILRAIDGREDLKKVAGYLNASRDDLKKEFPLLSSDGEKLRYTLFLPTSMAFMMQTPQDAGDPLVMDADFRRTILIRHFVRGYISPDILSEPGTALLMADRKGAEITRKNSNELCNLPQFDSSVECAEHNTMASWTFQANWGECVKSYKSGCLKTKNNFETEGECQATCDSESLTQLIKEREIQKEAIQLSDFGFIYVIDGVFMSGEEVSEILRKHPSPGFGFVGFPIQFQPKNDTDDGGFSTIDVKDAYIKDIADFATTAISANTNSASPIRLKRIIKAESQIVGGKNFKLTLEITSAVDAEANSLVCDVVVLEQWSSIETSKARQLKQSICFPYPSFVYPSFDI